VESCSILAEQLTKVLDGQNLDSGFMGSSPGTLSPATEALGRRALAALSGGRSGFAELLEIANLYVQGFVPEASLLFSRQERTPLSLPAYPFEKRPCWIGLDQPVAQKMAFDSVGRTGSSATSLIAEIQRLVCECTGLETARVEPQFTWTEMGLESMACLRLLAALNERFSLELQLADLIEYNNVQSLKAYIESNSPSASARPSSEPEKSAPAVGPGDWIARRLSLVPGTIQVRSESIPGEMALVPSLETCEPALAKLTTGGVAIYHGGSACHFFAHASVDIASVLAGLSKTERDALSTCLPTSLLFGPISQEQERNLFHSEILRQAAWNLQHTFTWTDGALDLKRLDLALAAVAESQDIIKTYYRRLGETWIQVVQPEAVLRCERVKVALVEDFQGLVVQAKSQLLALDRAPVFRVLVADIDDKWYLGVITHHSLADAFSSAMLMAEVERHYRTLATGGSLSPRPLEEQYWQYALEQFEAKTVRAESSHLFWESQFAGVGIANRLPYSVDPSSVSPELLPSAQARVVSLSSEDTSALVRFCKSQQTTLTQVFAAAVAMLCGPGLAQERAVFQYVNSQRNQWRLLKTLGEFTNVLFLPLKASPESSLMDCVRQVNASTLDALRHARFGFKDLLTLAGLKGYESYYGQLDNIVIDTVDFDAAEAASNAIGWRSISARVWADERVSGMEGQALATWFFQVVKVHDAVHLIASYRKHLFSPETMAEVCRLILDFVREIIRRPEVKVGEVLRNNQESLLGLQVLAERSLARAVRTEYSEGLQPRSTPVTRRASLPRECQRLNRVKSGRPVFWIHAGLGGVEAYQIFAQRSSRPFFGIHARGWMDEQPAIEGLDAMAAHYFDIIRSVQGGGPYDLGGYSLGGLLSYEITRLAQESGETVDSIVMLDSLDSVSLKRIHLSAKSDMLQTVNTALMVSAQATAGGLSSSLIHKDELDATLDDVVFLERLIGVARGRGLTLSDRQIKTLVRRRSKVQQGYRPMDFHLKPLPHPAEVSVHYFRNRSGLFLGELGPYYTLPGDRIDLDHFEYWAEWSRELPKLRIVDVPARSHGTFLSDLGVTQVIGDFCERLYSGLGEETGA
jgi:thioesterase domain-containing protein/acyl carrier protein